MSRRIRAVKREVRILGLDFCNKNRIVGAILRGGDFLDGVLTILRDENVNDGLVAHRIVSIRHYPELRVVMIHDTKQVSNPAIIERVSRLPVITVSEKKPSQHNFTSYKFDRGKLWARTNLPKDTATRIMSLAWTLGRLPEPIRVAHLLAQAKQPKLLSGK